MMPALFSVDRAVSGLAWPLKHGYLTVLRETMADSTTRLPRPRDPNELAKLIADIATGERDDRLMTDDGKDLAAVLLGRRGGLKGGPARAESMSAEQRSEIARRAADARWRKAERK